MSQISKIYASPHYLKEVYKDLNKQQQQAWLSPKKKRPKATKKKRPPRGKKPTVTAKQQAAFDLHAACQARIQQVGPHWGLYCADHNTWIKWIAKDQVEKVRDLIECGK